MSIPKIKHPFQFQSDKEVFLYSLYQELLQYKHSPDLPLLERKEWQLIFIPDELQLNEHKHELIAGHCEPQGSAITNNLFSVLKTYQNERPLVLPFVQDKWSKQAARVLGELWAVRPYRFVDMDNYKENGKKFIRIRVSLTQPFRRLVWFKDFAKLEQDKTLDFNNIIRQTQNQILSPLFFPRCKAWMYLAVPEFWREELDGGYKYQKTQKLPIYSNKHLGKYFKFNELALSHL